MTHRLSTMTIIALLLAIPAQGQTLRPTLDLTSARRMADACLTMAGESDFEVAVAIVDSGGNLKFFSRMDAAPLISVDLARDKASTSARLPMATTKLAEMAKKRPGIEFMKGVTILPGGLPIFGEDGAHLGGIGASGGSADQDVGCARAGLDAFARIHERDRN